MLACLYKRRNAFPRPISSIGSPTASAQVKAKAHIVLPSPSIHLITPSRRDLSMSFPTLGSSVGLAARALPLASSSSARSFSTSVVTLKKSNRARGATRKSPRNQALFAELSPSFGEAGRSFGGIAGAKASKKATSNLDAAEGETLLTLEQACEQLKAHGAASRPLNAFEVHIVPSVSSHQTNALRGRIAYPRDPRTKQERLLVFAEEGSEAARPSRSEVMEKEAATSSTSTAERRSSWAAPNSSRRFSTIASAASPRCCAPTRCSPRSPRASPGRWVPKVSCPTLDVAPSSPRTTKSRSSMLSANPRAPWTGDPTRSASSAVR